MNLPGFTAEASLRDHSATDATQVYRGQAGGGRLQSGVAPQLGISSDPDFGSYWRCRLNGGSELVCRFFGGLPPFTIGGLLTRR